MAATETESEATPAEALKKPLQIDVKVDVTSTCERHVVVSIPRAEVERYRQEAFNEVSPKAELPGFRAGKAPRKLVESRFKEQVGEQVVARWLTSDHAMVCPAGTLLYAAPPTNQCGETCERAKLCATCARGVEHPSLPAGSEARGKRHGN